MKKFDVWSIIIACISLFATVATGFLDQKKASIICLGLLALSWFLWVTIKIILLSNSINSGPKAPTPEESKESIGSIGCPSKPAKNPILYMPKYHFLKNDPNNIDSLEKKIKIPSDFLGWSQYSIIFWVNITRDFFSSNNNKYLFSYTTDSSYRGKRYHYPNAFFLGINSTNGKWRFVIKGSDPKNENKIAFPSHEGLRGWKMVSVRWHSVSEMLTFDIDSGHVCNGARKLLKDFRPEVSSAESFHLGGWLDTWPSGLSCLDFWNFRVFDLCLTNGDIKNIFESEKPKG